MASRLSSSAPPFVDDDAPESSQSSVLLACMARNIWQCPCHERAAVEFRELPATAQHDVWVDLTGSEAKLRRRAAGSPPVVVEEPRQMVNAALQGLSRELDKMLHSADSSSNEKLEGLRLALTKFPDYSRDRAFQIKFLRADRFDVEAAAQRMAIHFDCKLELWGFEKLGRDIVWGDLDEHDLDCLRRGYFQILPELDAAGRRIFFYYKALTNCYRERSNILRTVWYLADWMSHDESVQQLGVVNVVYNIGGFPEGGMDYEKSRRLSYLFRGLPVRFDSFIVCLDESPWLNVVEIFSFMVSKFIRVRMRTVQGSHIECSYKLMALGIPYQSLPVSQSSKLRKSSHLTFLETVVLDEESRRKNLLEQQNAQLPPQSTSVYSKLLQHDINGILSPYAMTELLKATAAHYQHGSGFDPDSSDAVPTRFVG